MYRTTVRRKGRLSRRGQGRGCPCHTRVWSASCVHGSTPPCVNGSFNLLKAVLTLSLTSRNVAHAMPTPCRLTRPSASPPGLGR
eukprot:3551330-Prymnesium_polylepis.1